MPEARLEAVVWDMDGVIVDSAAYHFRAWQGVFRKRGVNFTEADFKRNFGQRNDTIIKNTLGEDLPQAEIDEIAEEKERNYRSLIADSIKPLPGAINLIKMLHENGVKMAIASSAPLENIRLIARGLGIESYFQAVVWGREVTEGKPSPQGFLLAAGKLGIEPRNCVVIEDAIAGVAAAKRAGMKCLAVTATHPATSLKEADLVVSSLERVDLDTLKALFK